MAATGYVWTEFNGPQIVSIWIQCPQSSYVKARADSTTYKRDMYPRSKVFLEKSIVSYVVKYLSN